MVETRQEYLKRINFVLDFIDKNLDVDLSLEYLSKKAHYSPYHFHRVFLTVVNERLNEFINRKRIERIASILLVEPKIPLIDLAYKYGFNSDNSFSRAFKKYYGISPTKFKSEGKEILSKIGIEFFSTEKYICSINDIKQWTKMNTQITIKELPELKLASISHIGSFEKVANMFQKLMEWGHQKGILDTSNFKAITIYHDNPNVTQASKLRFSTCITISENINADGEIRQIDLQKGTYVVGHFEIKAEEISKAWKSMCIWVIENGYEFRDGDYFEMYHNDHKTHPEQKFILDICIPLQKTKNIKLGEINKVNLSKYKAQNQKCENNLDYHQLINYMKELRLFFQKEYGTIFRLGKIYQGDPNFSYFSLTTDELKKQKLKFVIILNHKELYFSICLSGQNKSIRKKYWKIFKGSDWNKYHLAESIDDSLSIIDQIIVEEPNFNNKRSLTEKIEKESMKFTRELKGILE
ncbi:AraC family transcriptional regulator [Polaribacter haliotis]|uniref:AraC family transcriptional regulator n=1 Tax=Polaribacter haliotis TaxID=1888915 RepID=A0A7L8ABL3_9FLAO|nr:AraC family transcriptional regulator [Polaribacter haliotis]QOD59372.1 AraC family transcriptional regulator [Polaribacter haliotis]